MKKLNTNGELRDKNEPQYESNQKKSSFKGQKFNLLFSMNYITAEEICDTFEFTRRTLRRRVSEGILTPHIIGGRSYFRSHDVMEMMKQAATIKN